MHKLVRSYITYSLIRIYLLQLRTWGGRSNALESRSSGYWRILNRRGQSCSVLKWDNGGSGSSSNILSLGDGSSDSWSNPMVLGVGCPLYY